MTSATCEDPDALQVICDRLGPGTINVFFQRWMSVLPVPLTGADQAAGYWWELSMRQIETSRTLVFDAPRRARGFFEALVADNLDLGRPDSVELIFTGHRGHWGRPPLAEPTYKTKVVTRDTEVTINAFFKHSRAAPGSPAVDAFAADLSVQAGVRRVAALVLDTYPRLDVLVNNVGGFWAHRHLTADGLERTFALNHLAPFLLTHLLLDRLTASAPARIVTVSSGAHTSGHIDFDDLQGERDYSGQRAYSQSKLANVMFTYELARRLEGTGVTATVCHPGVAATSFGAEDPAAYFAVMTRVARPFMKTPAHGALTPVYLASSPEVEGVTGRYFANCKPQTSSKAPYDTTAAARLWQVSADLAGMTATA